MGKIFEIVDNVCKWKTPYTNMGEVVDMYPSHFKFIEVPDDSIVQEGWGYRDKYDNGEYITNINDRFIPPTPEEGYLFDEETGFCYPESEIPVKLEEAQKKKQEENKQLFAKFLEDHPLVWVDGKTYGVTMEDQSEIQLNINQYQIQVQAGVENPVLEWHDIHKSCQPWTIENLSALVLDISSYVYPWFRKMQEYKSSIYACKIKSEVLDIKIVYKTEDELAKEENQETIPDNVNEENTEISEDTTKNDE